jgi:hypothetical protein
MVKSRNAEKPIMRKAPAVGAPVANRSRLFISSLRLHRGTEGCSRYRGAVNAGAHTVAVGSGTHRGTQGQ